MKQLLGIILLLIAMRTDAQIMSGLSTPAAGLGKLDVKVKNGKAYKNAYINNVPSAVMRDFAERCGEYEVSWFVGHKEVTGYYKDGDISYTVYYENERYLKTRSVYDSSHLATRVRDFLEFELGKTYKVNLVTEVRWEDERVYEISLVNDSKICMVKIDVDRSQEKLSVIEKKFITKL